EIDWPPGFKIALLANIERRCERARFTTQFDLSIHGGTQSRVPTGTARDILTRVMHDHDMGSRPLPNTVAGGNELTHILAAIFIASAQCSCQRVYDNQTHRLPGLRGNELHSFHDLIEIVDKIEAGGDTGEGQRARDGVVLLERGYPVPHTVAAFQGEIDHRALF